VRRNRVPRPLLAILGVVLVAALAWTFAEPPLQGADESAHFSYVQEIADAHDIPWRDSSKGRLPAAFGPAVSTELRTAWLWAGLEPLRGNLAARPLWTKEDERIWAREDAKLRPEDRRDAAGSNVFRNPPLYYLTATVPYKIAGGTFFDRLYAMRLWGVALLLVTVVLTWLLAGVLFGGRREAQVVAAVAVGMQPVLLDVTTRVTPDALLIPLCAAALYLMVLLAARGFTWQRTGLLVAVLAAACFTQGRAIAFVLPGLFAIGLAGWRRLRPPATTRPLGRGAVAAAWVVAIALLALGFGLYASRFSLGDIPGFWSYLWQFYLPKLPGMTHPIGPDWDVENVYLNRFFGTFVQFEVGFPRDLLDWIRVAIWGGLALLVVAAWRHRRALAARRDVVLVLCVAPVLVLVGVHAASFRALLDNPADPVITGRYLLMLIPLYGIAVAGALRALPGRARALTTGAVLAALVLLQLSAFGLVVERFYA
jgi:4-amino-4-deoxy-L-arabinose transferase-like glycosyltransferase